MLPFKFLALLMITLSAGLAMTNSAGAQQFGAENSSAAGKTSASKMQDLSGVSPHRGQLLSAPVPKPVYAASQQTFTAKPNSGSRTNSGIAQSPGGRPNTGSKPNPGGKSKTAQKTKPQRVMPSANQMMNMLDEVSSGKSPTLPNNVQRGGSQNYNRMTSQSVVRPGGFSNRPMNANNMIQRPGFGMQPSMGLNTIQRPSARGMSMGGMQHAGLGMGMSGTQHSGMGMGMGGGVHRPGGMGTMGGGAHMTGGNAASFFQQLQQKMAAMQPAAEGGAEGESSGMGGGGGMQAQLMQRLFHGGAPGAMQPAPQAPAMGGGQAPGSFIKRPSGITGIAGGASSAGRSAPTSSAASDLERQMEQQYGK